MVNELFIGGTYEHYKGNRYILKELARHSETLEWMVIYECLYDNDKGKIWVRPKDMFIENVQIEGNIVPRFKFIKL